MYTTRDIYPVSDFNRRAAEHIKRLQATKRPEVLTVNGKAALVMLDPETYDKLAQEAELAQTLAHITTANTQFDKGEGISVAKAFKKVRESLKARYPNAEL
jgi:PHD/YefM family antitoxin component YafN of YafNO toxin-antitoxin module